MHRRRTQPPAYTTPFKKNALLFLTPQKCRAIAAAYGTPVTVYDENTLRRTVETLLTVAHAYGFIPRYAVKANINATLITFLSERGVHFDASSHWEVERLLAYGVPAAKILLTAQEKTPHPSRLLRRGVELNATSLHQLRLYAAASRQCRRSALSIRVNPGLSSSVDYKTNVAGADSSFGIWHEALPEVHALAKHYTMQITRLHVHLSSNTDPEEWLTVIETVLAKLLPQLPDVTHFNVGGGFSVARYPGDHRTVLRTVLATLKKHFIKFYRTTGRKLVLELEPGAYLLATSGLLISTIDDITLTPHAEHPDPNHANPKPTLNHSKHPKSNAPPYLPSHNVFVKLNTGMNDLLRPALYGARHYMAVVKATIDAKESEAIKPLHGLYRLRGGTEGLFPGGGDILRLPAALEKRLDQISSVSMGTEVVFVGHCCEKGDLLTPQAHNPNAAEPRALEKWGSWDKSGRLAIGDYVLITGVGAYGSALANHYNSFPFLAECWLDTEQKVHLIRKRQTLKDLTRSEINIFAKSSRQPTKKPHKSSHKQ